MSERLSAGLLGIAVLGAVGCSQPPARPSAPQAPPTPPAQIAPWGLDLAARDSSVKPGDRSEERRVGKECRCRWMPVFHKEKQSTAMTVCAAILNKVKAVRM